MNFRSHIVKICSLIKRHCGPNYIQISTLCTRMSENQNAIPLTELNMRREKLLNKFDQYVSTSHAITGDNDGKKSRHIVILPGAEVQYMSYHVPYPFHQDSSFLYLTGLNEPNAVLVLLLSSDPSNLGPWNHISHCSYHLFVEIRSPKAIQWDGPTVGLQSARMMTGISFVHPRSDFKKFIHDQFISSPELDPLHLWHTSLINFNPINRPMSRSVLDELLEVRTHFQQKPIEFHNPDFLIDQIRLRKSEFEINLIRRAGEITSDALKSTMAKAYSGISEFDLHSRFEFEVRCRGALLGYPPVIGGGQRATIIHYLNNDRHVQDGELVLMDVGARVGGYTADLTRTWPINGVFSPIQRILHEILIEIQATCVRYASPQHSLNDLYQLMLKEMNRHLVSEKIIPEGSSIEIVRRICPHHVGHYLGLDVHDTPTVPNSQKLEPGLVFPIEPGFYFRPELKLIGVRNEFLNLGLRLEDDYVMLDNGTVSCLTSSMPTRTVDLQSLIGNTNSGIMSNLENAQAL